MSPIKSIQVLSFALAVGVALAAVGASEAKLLRRSRYYDDMPYDAPYGGAAATGERAILTVRGTRNPYDGSAPSKIAIEDNPYRGAYPRGVYDRLDGYSMGERYPGGSYPMRSEPYGRYSSPYGGYGGPMFGAPNRIAVTGAYPYGYGSRCQQIKRRRDFLDPDFGVRASLRLASDNGRRQQPSKCHFGAEADSEIPELGLDSGRLNIDCAVNPVRVAGAAYRAAQRYNQYKRAPSTVRRKHTRISFDREYIRPTVHHYEDSGASNGGNNEDGDDDDDD